VEASKGTQVVGLGQAQAGIPDLKGIKSLLAGELFD